MMLKTALKIAAAVLATGLLATGAGAVAYQAAEPLASSTTTGTATAPAGTATPPAAPPRPEAETIAEKALKAGSDLFDARDAAALAATYTEDGEILFVDKKDGQVREEVKSGRADVEKFYRDYFANAGAIDSENIVELARLISPDVLVIHGRFRPNTGQTELPFVQYRVKQGDRWLLSKLWLFLKPGHSGEDSGGQ